MTEKPTLVPLHRFASPNGNGLCTYRFGVNVCGRNQLDMFHAMTPAPAVETPPDPVRKYLDENGGAYQTWHGASFPVDDPPTTAQVLSMFQDQALRLAVAKDRAYRKAWVEQGYLGNVGRILSKAARLRALVWREETTDGPHEELAGETLRDTLLDMANLCAFAAHNIGRGNRWGDNG